MRSFVLITALLVAATGWGIAHLQSAADAAAPSFAVRPGEIASIAFDGRRLPANELRDLLASKPGTLLDDALLAQDRETLRAALVARGYLAAEVRAPQVTFDVRGAAFVTYAIIPGPLYRVRSVVLTGASVRDTGVITIGKEDPAEAERVARARQAIADRLKARGKHLTVTADVRRDDAAAAVDVVLAAR